MASSTEYYYMRKSGQIPAFGDWENANELPITQYFECARQAGLSSCNRECCSNGVAANSSYYVNGYYGYSNNNDLYGFGLSEYEKKSAAVHRSAYAIPQRKIRTGLDKSCSHMKEQRKQIKVRDLMDHHQPRNKNHHHHHHQTLSQNHYNKNNIVVKSDDIITSQQQQKINAKPVDEDLYKISSERIENPKRKKMLGFLYRCMAPPCAA